MSKVGYYSLQNRQSRENQVGTEFNQFFHLFSNKGRRLSSSGLKNGDDVKISGINVGKIIKLDLEPDDYNAKIYIKLNNEIKIPDDSQARITSSSLLGGNFLDIIPGSSETYLKPDDIIYDTTDAVSFTDLLGKVVFSKE